jgi:16S rRNA (cytosine1402-N4)-methyltransferase
LQIHTPVLLDESLRFLDIKPGGTYADLTLGLGGHAEEILRRSGPGGILVGIDRDAEALEAASTRLEPFKGRTVLRQAEFSKSPELIREAGFDRVDGFLMDLGVSMLQLKTPERGFSFSKDAPLDMRMDRTSGITAARLLQELDESELARIIFEYGEERWAKAIARRIKEAIRTAPVETTVALAEIVKGAIPKKLWPPRTHPATRTFQALRIAVNEELDILERTLGSMLDMLGPGGRAVVISYHSLEDRIVKHAFRERAKGCICPPGFPKCVCGVKPAIKILTGRPVLPSEEETQSNPSARSAKLRAAERLA